MELFLFINFSFFAILGALGLVFFKLPLHSALSFIVSLVAVAGLYLLLFAKTLFLIQIVVYAGAIMVLSVFVVMFFNVKEDRLFAKFGLKSLVWLVSVFVMFGFVLSQIWLLPGDFPIVSQNFGEMRELGIYLFSNLAISFEAISVLLTTALIGVVAVLKGKNHA